MPDHRCIAKSPDDCKPKNNFASPDRVEEFLDRAADPDEDRWEIVGKPVRRVLARALAQRRLRVFR